MTPKRQEVADIVEVEPGVYSVLLGGRSYELRVNGESADFRGRAVPVDVTDPRDLPGKKTAGDSGPVKVSSPMPGKVVRILVSVGDSVEAGQGVIVVEAMKMQNEMKSPRAGKVAAIKTKPGATVAAGELLALIE